MVVLESWPFSSGDGSVPSEDRWTEMGQALLLDGVLPYRSDDLFNATGAFSTQLSVFADSTGLQCKVRPGRVWIKGHIGRLPVQTTLPLGVADPSNPRTDVVIARLNKATGTKNIEIVVKPGTPSVVPSPPALAMTDTLAEIPLANVILGAGAVTIAAGAVSDRRIFAQPRRPARVVRVRLAAATNGHVGYGVASSDHPGTGRYRVVFAEPFLTTGYAVLATPQGNSALFATVLDSSMGTTGLEVRVFDANGTLTDANWVNVDVYEAYP